MSHQLKLQQLKYFIAVAEELSFRRAAERLFITQPPLSRQIKALEATLGARLLERDRQGVRLTEAGGSFLANARSVVRESEQLVLKFNRQRDHIKSTVTLGITTVVDVSLFAWVDAAFEARVPGVRVSVKRQTSAQSIRELHQGAIDVAVIGLPSRAEGLTIEHLCDDPMAACIASTHPLAQKRRVSIVDLQHDNLFWFARKLNPAYYDYCQRVFERVGFNPRRLAEPTDHHVLLGLIALGQGIALVPKSLGSVTRKGVVFKEMVEGDQLCIRVVAAFQAATASEPVLALVAMLKERFLA